MGRVNPSDVERELAAQIDRVKSAGVRVTHLDSHQHLHLWPLVGDVALRLAKRFQIPAIRVPRSRGGRLAGMGVNFLARRLASNGARAGLASPKDAAGFDEAGRVDLTTLVGVLSFLAEGARGAVELGVHPGEPDDPARARYRWDYRWGAELEALTDPRAHEAVDRLGLSLVSFAALAS
jgi:predicted glycoside hydrolase/deacetylase ChbG (UPF0249 family)